MNKHNGNAEKLTEAQHSALSYAVRNGGKCGFWMNTQTLASLRRRDLIDTRLAITDAGRLALSSASTGAKTDD